VNGDLIERARNGDGAAFAELTEPFMRRLHTHCYRMLGSVHDAEDALQETLLAAWKDLPGFEGRASIGTWLYQIATRRCLNMLRSARRRPETDWPPPGLVLPEPTGRGGVTWLEPYPDAMLADLADPAQSPEGRYVGREAISLAFVTAVQLLPPRQRAVLILRDVLGFTVREVAQTLESSEESVASAQKRARATLQRHQPAGIDYAPAGDSVIERELVESLTRAYERADIGELVALLADQVLLTMPPIPLRYQGRALVASFLAAAVFRPGFQYRLIPVRANGQPAFAVYLLEPSARLATGNGVLVFTLAGDRVAAITRFDKSVLHFFGLPAALQP
jgi:RNA polymerase sigma-70 factor (ECF subfamily)